MAVAQVPFLAAVLLLVSSGLHCSSTQPACPESCTCQRASLLNCSSSGLSVVPQHIQDSVSELDLSHNFLNFVTLHQPHYNLRNVWLENNSITHLSLCIERDPRSQYVRGRRLHGWGPWSRGCVSWAPTLHLLSVERNQLVQLPEGLDGSESLQVLQLSFNRISTLQPRVLSNLRKLKELHLQHNLITNLHPQMFQDLAQLRVLDLSFNMLTSLHPVMYLSLRNIGTDVSLDGNRWQCDCGMRSLRRWMAYDSSRGLQSWSIVCDSPSILSGRDLLQLKENDLNCFSTENRPELHQDVTVYSGSKILLSCSTQDSLWWTPNGQASVGQSQAGLLMRDITERDTGLYVCVSGDHEVVSVFNLHISRIGRTRRKTRSLSRTSQQIITQGTSNRMGQVRNQKAQSSNLTLAVCLSVFITFLIAFILGVLARPLIEVLWRKVTNKKSSSEINAVSVVEETQYDNEAYSSVEDPEETETHRGRRVTFSTVEFREDSSVSYYDTMDDDEQESINNDPVIECEAPEAEKDKRTEDSGSENSLRQISPKDNQQRYGRERTHNMELEHIPDPVELEERLSSYSDSSLSNKELKEDQMTQGHHTTPKSPQLAEDSVQQTADFSRQVEMPQFSIEGKSEIPGFSSEPFVDWLPHINTTSLTDPELWQENEEELFEFSDSARSSSRFGSFNESISIVAPTSNKQNGGDMSSSSSYLSGDEPSQYTVNSDPEEEDDTEKNNNESEVSFKQIETPDTEVLSLPAAHSSDSSEIEAEIINLKVKHKKGIVNERIEFNEQETLKTIPQIKKYLDIQDPLPSSDSSSSDESVDETTNHIKKQEQEETLMARPPIKETQTVSHDPETRWPALNLEHIPRIPRRLDIKAPSPASDLLSSSNSEDETTGHTEMQRPDNIDIGGLTFQETQTLTHDLEQMTHIKRRLDIKAPSPASDLSSSSDSEDETRNHIKKQEQEETLMARPPIKETQTVTHDPETRWPALNLEHIPRIPRRLDIKARSPASALSSSSNSEDETTGHTETQRPDKIDIGGLTFQETHVERHDPETRWPTFGLENTTCIKRRLDIKAPSPASDLSSSSDSEDETTNCIKKQEQEETLMARPPIKETQTVSHDPETRWPTLNLEHIPRIPRRLNIKAPSPSSALSISNSEDITTGHTEMQRPDNIDIGGLTFQETQTLTHDLEHMTHIKRHLDIKAPSPASDLSSSSDSEDETRNHIKKQEQEETLMARPPIKKTQTVSHDPETRWPALNLEHIPRIPRRLDIKAPSPASDLSSSSNSEDEITYHTEKQRPEVGGFAGLPFKKSQPVSHDPGTQWPPVDLGRNIHKRRFDIKAPSPLPDSLSNDTSQDFRQFKLNSSTSDSEDDNRDHKAKLSMGASAISKPAENEFIRSPKTPVINISHSPKTDHNINLVKYTVHTDDLGEKTTSDISRTPEINPELQSQWATMDLGFSRFRKNLEITTHEPPNLPSSLPPDSPSFSSSESGIGSKSSRTKQKKGRVMMQRTMPIESSLNPENKPVNVSLSLRGRDDNSDNSVEAEDRLRRDYNLPKTEEKSKPDTRLTGTQRVRRNLDIKISDKAPDTPPSSASVSSSENEDESTEHASKGWTGSQNRTSLYVAQTVDINLDQTLSQTEDAEISWMGVSRHLSDLSISKRHLDASLSYPPAKPEHLPPDSSNSSSSESDDKIKQERGKADATSMHKYASLGLSSVSLSSSRALGKFDNSSSNTNEIWRVSPEDRKERKGLSALKAMSSERRKWDTEDKKVDTGTSLYDDHQGDISSIHHRSEEYIKPLVKQSKPELLISSTSANERKASDLLYAIPLYKRHDFEAPQELPPPIPATPPPDED